MNYQNKKLQIVIIIVAATFAIIGGALWRSGRIENGAGFWCTFPLLAVSAGLALIAEHKNVKIFSFKIFILTMVVFFAAMAYFPA
jgi:hypothetical protein